MKPEKAKYQTLELVASEQLPICPHCEKEIGQISSRGVKRSLAVLYCPHCRKVLGTAVLV